MGHVFATKQRGPRGRRQADRFSDRHLKLGFGFCSPDVFARTVGHRTATSPTGNQPAEHGKKTRMRQTRAVEKLDESLGKRIPTGRAEFIEWANLGKQISEREWQLAGQKLVGQTLPGRGVGIDMPVVGLPGNLGQSIEY